MSVKKILSYFIKRNTKGKGASSFVAIERFWWVDFFWQWIMNARPISNLNKSVSNKPLHLLYESHDDRVLWLISQLLCRIPLLFGAGIVWPSFGVTCDISGIVFLVRQKARRSSCACYPVWVNLWNKQFNQFIRFWLAYSVSHTPMYMIDDIYIFWSIPFPTSWRYLVGNESCQNGCLVVRGTTGCLGQHWHWWITRRDELVRERKSSSVRRVLYVAAFIFFCRVHGMNMSWNE